MPRGYHKPLKQHPRKERAIRRKATQRAKALAALDRNFLSIWLSAHDVQMAESHAIANNLRGAVPIDRG